MIFNGYSIGQQKRVTLVNCWKKVVLVYSYMYELIKSYNTALSIYSTRLSLVAFGQIKQYILSCFFIQKKDIISLNKKKHLHTNKTEPQMFLILIKIHIEYR